ncbi:hypothetical protein AA313_de0201534 [Arthrobotrys entomopaga]|nr:hypothetical protein AA313_de0201534 [Arthrobotrys entomopaga]
MSFVPELVSTTRFSNRTKVAANVDGSGDAKPHENGSSNSTLAGAKADSKPRFLPEPIETTRRSNRTIASGSSSPLSSNSSTPKATLLTNNNNNNNTFETSPAAAAVVLPSSGGTSQKSAIPAFKTSKFSPEPVETTRRSNRTQAVEVERTRKNGWGRDSDDEETENQKKELERKHLNQATHHQQRRIPAPFVGAGKSKWFPDDNTTTWGTHPSVATRQQPAASFQGAGPTSSLSPSSSSSSLAGFSLHPSHSILDANVNVSDDVSSKAKSNSKATISSQVRDQISGSNNGDPRQISGSANNKDAVAGIAASSNRANANTPRIARSGDDSEVTGTASLSSSPASSLKSNASGPNYLLESTTPDNGPFSHCPSRDLTVIPLITNSQYFSPSSSSSEGAASSPQTAVGPKRPISPGIILIQDFAYNSSRPTPLKLPRADHASPCNWPGAAADVPKPIPENKIAQQHISHTNIQPPPPRSGLTDFSSLDPSKKFDITSPSTTSVAPTTVTLLRDQVLAAQSQLIKDKALLTPTYGLSKFQPQLSSSTLSPPNGSNEPKRKKPLLPFSFIPAAPRAVNSPVRSPNQPHLLSPNFPPTPLLCESPMPTTLFYESSKTNTVDYFSSKRTEKQASAMSISSNASSVVSHDTALTTPSTRASSPGPHKYGYPSASTSSMAQMMCETPKPLSAESPNMNPTKRSEVTTEFVLAVFNYLSLNHESVARKFDKELSAGTGWSIERVVTDRLGALREYVEDYVERKPSFGSGIYGW